MSDIVVSRMKDQPTWRVGRQETGFATIRMHLTSSRNARSGAPRDLVAFDMDTSLGRMKGAFATAGRDWRYAAFLLDREFFFGQVLSHNAWNIDTVGLAKNLRRQIKGAAWDQATEGRLLGMVPEAVQVIAAGRRDIPHELDAALPEDWDETLVPRRIRPELVAFWSDTWRPFVRSMKRDVEEGVPEPGAVEHRETMTDRLDAASQHELQEIAVAAISRLGADPALIAGMISKLDDADIQVLREECDAARETVAEI